MTIPNRNKGESLLDYAYKLANIYKETNEKESRKGKGQFFTSPKIAAFMATLAKIKKSRLNMLDPGTGTGILAAAVLDRILKKKNKTEIHLDVYETDHSIIPHLTKFLQEAKKSLNKHNHIFNYEIHEKDFVLTNAKYVEPKLGSDSFKPKKFYDIIISNPPYFKLSKSSKESIALSSIVKGQPNIYSFFMAISAAMLAGDGQMIFITPRSFCSGSYYSKFRKWFVKRVTFSHIHLFSSRKDVFSNEEVLQENIIFSANKKMDGDTADLELSITTSEDANFHDLSTIQIPNSRIIYQRNGDLYILIPSSELELDIIKAMTNFPYLLKHFDYKVSTGPVVPFRTKENLVFSVKDLVLDTVPLIWMHNFNDHKIIWPAFKNGNAIAIKKNKKTIPLLIPKGNYVLMKRFSSKEEKRRLKAVVLLEEDFKEYTHIGIENRVNYIYRKGTPLTKEEAIGLAAIFNTDLHDLFFRILNGHTQVNANELNAMPIPDQKDIKTIGQLASKKKVNKREREQVISKLMKIPKRIFEKIVHMVQKMDKTKEALEILKQLQVPKKQQNERSALCLLAMLSIEEESEWSDAKKNLIRIHDIMQFISENYNKTYAENSRETFRRQTLQQFEQEGLVERNPDEPRPTNSPNTVWAVHGDAISLIKKYGTADWKKELEAYLLKKGKNVKKYIKEKKKHTTTIVIEGDVINLSPGKHNELQKEIVETFRNKFCNNATILYLGDTANKMLFLNEEQTKKLGINITKHDKLPDVVMYDPVKKHLFLIEAVTSHGPVSKKRQIELEGFLKDCKCKKIYVSAFPSFTEFKKYISEIAWETEVWLSDIPEHMIHFNGDKFLNVN